MESNIFRKGEREWEVGRGSQNTREQGEEEKNECMQDKNYPIACDWCVHECDSKIMMYNFNMRRNIAQQEKKNKIKKLIYIVQ